MIRFLVQIIVFCQKRAGLVVLFSMLLTGLCGYYAARTLDINTDTSKLISPDRAWAKQSAAFDAAFPQDLNVTAIVIDGASSDAVADGTAQLAAALTARTDIFRSITLPDSGAFFNRHGLMFLDTKELSKVSDQIAEAQPLLGPLAADPSLRGLFTVLGEAINGVSQGETSGEKLSRPLEIFAGATQSVVAGPRQPVDWSGLMTGQTPRPEELRHFIEVQAKLNYDELQPGAAASKVIRDTAQSLHLAEQGVRVRLTGDVPLEDDEFAAVTRGAGQATAGTAVVVVFILLLGLRSPKLIFAIVMTVVVGLILTAAFAAAAVGTLNMISVAFAVLFIGIGADFGIQFSMRYRAELFSTAADSPDTDGEGASAEALRRTAWFISGPLSVAALATSVGFFSFLPTSYRGVSELGEIAGTSMLIALVTNLTLLPALLFLLRGKGKPEEVGFHWAKPIDHWVERYSKPIVLAATVFGVISILLIPSLRFDSDPLDLKDPRAESVQTAVDLTRNSMTSPYSVNVLVPDVNDAAPLADRLGKLPEVSQVIWLGSLIPEYQDEKLDILSQLQIILGPMLDQNNVLPTPTPEQEHQALDVFSAKLKAFLASGKAGLLDDSGQSLLMSLEAFQNLPGGGDVAVLRETLLDGLEGRLNVLREAVQAQKLTLATMPDEIKSQWVGKGGHARIEVFPKGNMKDSNQMAAFVAAVRAAAPNATGPSVSILESGLTVSNAFRTASITALIAISITLIVVLRRARDVALVLFPLILAGLFTLGTCVAIGLAFNYANVIAVPLLMGIGVAFDIYFVMAWRRAEGPVALLQSPTARAVLFSAATTTTAFGSLALSAHVGTASMGQLLMLSLFYVVLCTLFIQPALMSWIGRGKSIPS